MADREFEERFEETWNDIAENGDSIPTSNLKNALDHVGIKLPMYRVRELLNDLKTQGKACDQKGVSKEVFREICNDQKRGDMAEKFKTTNVISEKEATKDESTTSYGFHTIMNEEQMSFARWLNRHLGDIAELSHLLPLADDGDDLYTKIGDGILLCKLINFAVPETIDDRAINTGKKVSLFKKHENLSLAINSAKSIGCHVVNMDSHTLGEGDSHKHLVLGLMWQIIARFLFNKISLQEVPGLIALLQDGETIEDLLKLSPEQLLTRWVNYQLDKAGVDRRLSNFSKDIKDSEVYTHLMHQIAPKDAGVNKLALQKSDLTERAEETLKQADKIDCNEFVTPYDIVHGIEKLNLAFVANLFNTYPALEEVEEVEGIKETREEKMFRNWMNSLGVNPFVNYLYTDLQDGLILFQIYEFIQPGIVNWNKVTRKFSGISAKKNLQILENCNYAVELGKKLNFVLVGIQGDDIKTGNKMLTLALVWQLMRKYTLSLLAKLSPDGSPIVESEIIHWANQRLQDADKETSIKHFQDPALKSSLPVIDLVDAIKEGAIDYSVVKKSSGKLGSVEAMSNAKYAITMARRIGAPVYALPEDLTEGKHKMVMTIFASLMLVDMS